MILNFNKSLDRDALDDPFLYAGGKISNWLG